MAHTSARMEEEGADGSGQETRGRGIRTWATSFQTLDTVSHGAGVNCGLDAFFLSPSEAFSVF